MTSYSEMGTGIFVVIFCINIFLIAFGGLPTSSYITTQYSDVYDTSPSSYLNNDINTSINASSKATNPNETSNPFFDIYNTLQGKELNLIKRAVFGLTEAAYFIHLPAQIILAVILPIQTFFVIYLFFLIIQLAGVFFGGGLKQ